MSLSIRSVFASCPAIARHSLQRLPVMLLCALLVVGPGLASASQEAPASNVSTVTSSAPDFAAASDRVIVKFRKDVSASAGLAASARAGARGVRSLKHTGISIVDLRADGPGVKQAIASLEASGLVEYAEPDYVIQLDAAYPDDPSFPSLWGLDDHDDTDIDAPEAWDITTGDPGIVVAVIDTGVDYNHEELAENMWVNPVEVVNGLDDDGNGYVDDVHGINAITGSGDPLDDHSHGTHVAGTIGAVANNGVGVAGVAWTTRIMALKFLSASGSGYTSDAVECLEYATRMRSEHGVDIRITNNSWGGGGNSQALRDAIEASGESGMLFVAAAGNSAADTDALAHYPSSYDLPNIVSVAATDSNDLLASFSNYGNESVDLGAPGVGILSTVPGNVYGWKSGTSMAAPHVTGAAALVWARNPELDPVGVRQVLMSQVDPLASLAGRVATGGRLNAFASLWACEAGVPTLVVSPGAGFELPAGEAVGVTVTLGECGSPILGATVTVAPSSGPELTARDDGVAPDVAPDDGVYSARWMPVAAGSTTLDVEAGFAGGSLTESVGGEVIDVPVYAVDPEAQFDWIDTTPGTTLGPLYDDSAVVIPIGFAFSFYGETQETVQVSSNGYLTFGELGWIYANQPVPSNAQPNDLIAPYWDDLNPAAAGTIASLLEGEAPNRRLTVAWTDVPYFSGGGTATFEVTLYEATGEIRFQYLDVGSGVAAHGASATVGIEDSTGASGLQYSLNQAVIADGLVVSIRELSACSDGRDNDGDGSVDFPEDEGCSDPEDDSELDDADGDGAADAFDNCLEVGNADQTDSDLDGFGNACDADYDNDGVVEGNDFATLIASFGEPSAHNPALDSDGDGRVASSDFALLVRTFGGPPGPSGLSCAGSVPCEAP